jgi:trans-aconitate 2-methyltransferase
MKNNNDWNPDLYLKYRNERTQASIDLVNRISIDFIPEKIIDIGCGPGNSSEILRRRWQSARIVGLDSSASMIEKAKSDYPDSEWIIANALTYETKEKFDVVFSNATIQWIPNHKELLKKFYGMLSDRGIIAVQLPLFRDMPLGKAIENVSKLKKWKSKTDGVSNLFTIHDYFFYYDVLSKLFNSIDLWVTNYIHILESQFSILEFIRSSGLKPYLERLDSESEKLEFEEEVLGLIKKDYPLQENGKVLVPFKRLFFIAYK